MALADEKSKTCGSLAKGARPAVLWRTGCFGTQSETGSRSTNRLLTVNATCWQHDKHMLAFLTMAVEARWSGQPAPKLVGG
jgi:hypothetical protein